jgi:hypothetical protein
VQQIRQGVVPDGADKGVGVGGTSCIEVEGQAVNNFVDRRDALRLHGGTGWEYAWDNYRSHVHLDCETCRR